MHELDIARERLVFAFLLLLAEKFCPLVGEGVYLVLDGLGQHAKCAKVSIFYPIRNLNIKQESLEALQSQDFPGLS